MLRLICHSLVPALALGFDALHTRVEAQTQQAATQQEKLKVRVFLSAA